MYLQMCKFCQKIEKFYQNKETYYGIMNTYIVHVHLQDFKTL